MSRKNKKSTPEWVDRLLEFREEIGEDEYRDFWKTLNKIRNDPEAWDEKGKEIIREIEGDIGTFRAKDFGGSVENARKAAEIFQSDEGGRIVRRDSKGRFNKKGKTFQVIGARTNEKG